jgi:hypothetical protein
VRLDGAAKILLDTEQPRFGGTGESATLGDRSLRLPDAGAAVVETAG